MSNEFDIEQEIDPELVEDETDDDADVEPVELPEYDGSYFVTTDPEEPDDEDEDDEDEDGEPE